MAQAFRTFAPPNAGSFPVTFGPADMAGIRSVEVDNGSALTLTLTANGQIIRTIAPYIPRFSLNTGGGWDTVSITADGATIQPTDSLTVNAYDTAITPPLLPSYGPAAWGGGAVPSTLVNVNPGDQFMAWQVQQIIDYLGGGLPGSTTFQLGPGQAFTVEDSSFTLLFEVLTTPITVVYFRVPVNINTSLVVQGRINALGSAQSVTGSRGGNAALASLLTQLAAIGLIADNSTP